MVSNQKSKGNSPKAHLDIHCLVVYEVYQLSLSLGVREPWRFFYFSVALLGFLFPHFLCPSPGFPFICMQTYLLTQIVLFLILGVLMAIESVCLSLLCPKNMRHLQQGRFCFKWNNLTFVIFLPGTTVCLPQLASPSSSGRHLLPGRRCPQEGQPLESMFLTGPSVTLSNVPQFSEYNRCLNGRMKPLPSLLRNVPRIVSCNKLPNQCTK